MRPDLAERGARLVAQKVDNVTWAVGAERAEAPEEGLAGECRVSAECKRTDDIGAAAHAAVEQDRGARADFGGDRWQHIDRGRQRFDLVAAVVRDPDAVDTERQR